MTSSGDKPVAIEIVAPPDTIAVNDTVPITVRVLNRAGDPIAGAVVVLVSLTPDTVGVDSARVAVVGKHAGPGRLFARSGDLPSEPFPVIVK